MKISDVLFWLLILAIIAIAIWLLSESSLEINALISITLFVAASEILLWKTLFSNDKKTSTGFEKIKNNLDLKFKDINNQLNEIKGLIKR